MKDELEKVEQRTLPAKFTLGPEVSCTCARVQKVLKFAAEVQEQGEMEEYDDNLSQSCFSLVKKRSVVELYPFTGDLFNVRERVSVNLNSGTVTIEVLNGGNYKKWKRDIEFALGLADIDVALREDQPVELADDASDTERRAYTRWERSNRLSLLAMKKSIGEHLLSGLPETNSSKDFFDAVGKRYYVSDKFEAGNLMSDLSDNYIVHTALNSLPIEFSQIKTAYNIQNESWTVLDLISKCVSEKEKIKRESGQSAVLVAHPGPKPKKSLGNFKKHHPQTHKKAQNTNKYVNNGQTQNLGVNKNGFKKEIKCYHCKKPGHKRFECTDFQAWLEKKKKEGNPLALVCFESNLVNAPINSWWLNSGVNVHVAISLQGFLNKRKPRDAESKIGVLD
ncbi:hypothetical protein BUALT_Bualt02G0101400 [Buddleja alternifolia]|uniref:CCHC-type domain-containing protein n=1 Tax=Buddleja alternifolia TaxID=168488 RepID=A0AAV6Y624_9LAMI|nr:hypothetical protein BUALT_Bualt02G0101400 [Buddleja alternifolia]